MTTDEIRALEPNARRRLQRFADCFAKGSSFDYFVSYSLALLAHFDRKSIEPIALWIGAAVRTLQLFLSQFVWDHATDRIAAATGDCGRVRLRERHRRD